MRRGYCRFDGDDDLANCSNVRDKLLRSMFDVDEIGLLRAPGAALLRWLGVLRAA